jgi:hypothetical protein
MKRFVAFFLLLVKTGGDMKYTRINLFVVWMLLMASTASAQTSDWRALEALPTGTKVKIALNNNPTFGHCRLNGVSDEKLTCNYGKWPLTRQSVYHRDDIKAVFLTHDGMRIGLAVGAGAGAVLGAANNTCCRASYALFGAGVLGAIGMFIGAVADPFFHGRAVYRSSQDPVKVRDGRSSPNSQNASQASGKISSCLRDGVALQCVQ